MHSVHHFWTSTEAYNASLDATTIREGDVLVIVAERVVGLASSDPIAVTVENGVLRSFPAMPRDRLLAELVHGPAAVVAAVTEATQHGYKVAPNFRSFAPSEPGLLRHEAHVILTLDDIAIVVDALDHRAAALTHLAKTVDPQSSHGLFVRQHATRLQRSREHLSAYSRSTPGAAPSHGGDAA